VTRDVSAPTFENRKDLIDRRRQKTRMRKATALISCKVTNISKIEAVRWCQYPPPPFGSRVPLYNWKLKHLLASHPISHTILKPNLTTM
jgi:hypothetical protein